MGAVFCAPSNAWGIVHPDHRLGDERHAPHGNALKLSEVVSEMYGFMAIIQILMEYCSIRASTGTLK
jgi:hypothetical protein